jgi:hypothetical protein
VRGELPSAFTAAAAAPEQRPVNLLVLKFDAGWAYLSDRDLGAAEGLSHDYLGLVREWGELSDLPLDEEGVAETRELTVTLWNGGDPPFSDRFGEQDPESIEAELWQWFEGTPESAAVLIDTFTVADPIAYDEAGQELRLDLVTVSVKIDQTIGELIEAEDYPNAPEESVGRVIPLVFGTVPDLPCNCIDAPAECKLALTILPTDKTIAVDDASKFPGSGVIQIDDERLLYRSRTDTAFTISARGYAGTVAVDHLSGRVVAEVADYVFAACKGPVKEITQVRVDGLVPETDYTLQITTNPATITFDGPPKVSALAEATRFLEMQFDAVVDGNTALKPELAFDDTKVTSAAEISESHRELRLKQVTVNANRGEIRKVWLGIEHWEAGRLDHDRVDVEIVGSGVLGKLATANPADVPTAAVDIDIDHGHTHSFTDEHEHVLTDPLDRIEEEPHAHGDTSSHNGSLSSSSVEGWSYYYDGFGNKIFMVYGTGNPASVGVSFTGLPGSGQTRVQITARYCSVYISNSSSARPAGYYSNGTWGEAKLVCKIDPNRPQDWVTGSFAFSGPHATLYLTAEKTYPPGYQSNSPGSYIKALASIQAVTQYVTTTGTAIKTGVSLQTVRPGHVLVTDGLAGGVKPLTGSTTTVEVEVSAPTKSVVDWIDLTSRVAGSWGWFTNKELRVRYVGSADNRTVYLLHCWFEVEYSPREIEVGGVVTCTVDGLIDDAAGTITGTPNRRIRRPDEVRKYLLVAEAGLDAAKIDSESFGGAGARYNTLAYRFDHAQTAQTTLKELERRLARQCRSRWYWDGGKAKIAVRERDADLWPVKHIVAGMVLLDSMRAERSPLSGLANRIRLFYRKDLGSPGRRSLAGSAEEGSEGYLASKRARNEASISAHGLRERPEDFLFDAVRDDAMAADLLAFYLEKEGRIRTTYTCDCFLDVFELEKEDAIRLTHPFDGLAGHIAVVRAASRVLGSGEGQRADLVRVSAELLPRRRLSVSLADRVRILDALAVGSALELHLSDAVRLKDDLRSAEGMALNDAVAVSEALGVIHDSRVELTDAVGMDEDLQIGMVTPTGLQDTIFIEDRLTISINSEEQASLGDAVTVGDVLAVGMGYNLALQDAVSMADSLTITLGGGYGIGGFGTQPFGR